MRPTLIASVFCFCCPTSSIAQVSVRPLAQHLDSIGGLTRLPDQTVIVVGSKMLPPQEETDQSEARFVTVAPDGTSTPTTLASLSGGTITHDKAINISSNGRYVVGRSASPVADNEPILWDRENLNAGIALGLLPGSMSSSAVAVSDAGTAVGEAVGLTRISPLAWIVAGSESVVQELPHVGYNILGIDLTLASSKDVSADGSLIVGASQDGSIGSEATKFTTTTHSFLSDTGLTDGQALAISPNGTQIAGFSIIGNSISGAPDTPTVWHNNGSPMFLQSAEGPIIGRATSVADNGFATGFAANGEGTEDDVPFIWQADFENGHAVDFVDWLTTIDPDAELPGTPREITDIHWHDPFLDFAVVLEEVGPHLISVFLGETLQGDFNMDATVDVVDLDLLCGDVAGGGSNLNFDLDGDSDVDQDDVDAFLANLGSFRGDANLDAAELNGGVNFNDFLILANNFNAPSSWSGGDFNCDGAVNFLDFLQLAENFGKTAGDVNSVPEPSTAIYTWTAFIGCACVFRILKRS